MSTTAKLLKANNMTTGMNEKANLEKLTDEQRAQVETVAKELAARLRSVSDRVAGMNDKIDRFLSEYRARRAYASEYHPRNP